MAKNFILSNTLGYSSFNRNASQQIKFHREIETLGEGIKIQTLKQADFMTEKRSNPEKSNLIGMPRVHKRKYEKIDQAEIDLVVQCQDSHEFYQRYRDTFPDRKKGVDSIGKIWKRRGEFIKKLHPEPEIPEGGTAIPQELINMIAAQTRILSEMSLMVRDQLEVTKEILRHLPKWSPKAEDPLKPATQLKPPEHKEPAKKPAHEKPPADIMIGS